MSNRREGVARLPGRTWPAGGDDALTLMRLQSDRALGWLGWIAHRNRRLRTGHQGRPGDVRLAHLRLPREHDGGQFINTAAHALRPLATIHTAPLPQAARIHPSPPPALLPHHTILHQWTPHHTTPLLAFLAHCTLPSSIPSHPTPPRLLTPSCTRARHGHRPLEQLRLPASQAEHKGTRRVDITGPQAHPHTQRTQQQWHSQLIRNIADKSHHRHRTARLLQEAGRRG
jgi:hypothetical protein